MKSAFNIPEDRISTAFSLINKPAKSSLYLTATNIFAKACSLVFTPIFTRILSPMEYGSYSLFLSYLSVLLVIGTLELSQSAVMRAMQKQRSTLHLTLLTASGLTIPASALALTVFIIIRELSGGGELFPHDLLFLATLCLSNGIINLYLAKSRFLYQWRSALAAAVVQSLLIPIGGIFILTLAKGEVNHVTAKLAVASLLTLALALVFAVIIAIGAVKEVKEHFSTAKEVVSAVRNCAATLLKLSLPLLPYYLSIMIISQLNRHFILESFGKEAVAVFSVAYSLGIAINSAFSGIVGSLCPWIMRKIRAKDFDKIEKTTAALVKISGIGIVVIAAFFREMLSVIAPSQYSAGLSVALISALIPIPLSLISLTSATMVAGERVMPVLISGAVSAMLAIILNVTLLPKIGIAFSAAVTLISYISVFALQSFGARKVFRRNIISPGVFAGTLILSVSALAVIYLLSDFIIARAAISAVFLIALIFILKDSKWILEERHRAN